MVAYIFGYGSLLHPEDWAMQEASGEGVYGFLENHSRHFRVGIDNQDSRYDKKHYLEEGQRADIIIGTLGLDQAAGASTNGLAIPVGEDLFKRIRIRERSYFLSDDLRSLFSQRLPAPLFTYYPRQENCDLYHSGMQQEKIFMPQRYLDYCAEGFAAYRGEDDFFRLTEELPYPVKELDFYRAPGAL